MRAIDITRSELRRFEAFRFLAPEEQSFLARMAKRAYRKGLEQNRAKENARSAVSRALNAMMAERRISKKD